MIDRISQERRSANMAAIRATDTKPELIVRRALRSMGFGYRLHHRKLPGRPDIVMLGRRKVIFVHGCFWHRHVGCRFAYTPKSRLDFWRKKFESNVSRDVRNRAALQERGWDVLVLWECEVSDAKLLTNRLQRFLGDRCVRTVARRRPRSSGGSLHV